MQGVYDFGKAPYRPHSSAKQVIWIWHEIGELVFGRLPKCRSLGQAGQAVRETADLLWSSVDAVLDPADPLPFLGLHYMQVMPLPADRLSPDWLCMHTSLLHAELSLPSKVNPLGDSLGLSVAGLCHLKAATLPGTDVGCGCRL